MLPDTFCCPSCGFFKSTFRVQINEIQRIDESAREQALKPIRTANFKQLLDECGPLLPLAAHILDVGCAHGWFLEAAKKRGYEASGIEPDREMAQKAHSAGHSAIVGFFPDALPVGEQYDAITFNDVFEHLPDVEGMAQAVHARLKPDGLALINLPVSDGMVFRSTRIAAKLGLSGPLERMWQKGLPSPHLSYFSARTLRMLMESVGFTLVKQGNLNAIATEGLYARIRYDKNVSTWKALGIYGAAHVMRLVGRVTASDIQYFAFKKSGLHGVSN
ncbi:class I SAM-dependent methyltransferase [Microvirga ossetica]|uniref:class I SAM-dependent methyltransferase n=1 Tax=Microvirga ossetica TaxID=1882682 RepID=UPI0012FFD7B2|nr:class I SAM-dependent methyltransferase [Microvirga ossetica]